MNAEHGLDEKGRPIEPVTEQAMRKAGQRLLELTRSGGHSCGWELLDIAYWLLGDIGNEGSGYPKRAHIPGPDPAGTDWEREMRGHLGRRVRITIGHNDERPVTVTGELLWFEDSGQFMLRDPGDGHVSMGWPLLAITHHRNGDERNTP